MTALYEQTDELHDTAEIHWSSGTILAIFFAAALISAVFFGLGYSFGGDGIASHSVAKTTAAANAPIAASPLPQSSLVASASTAVATSSAENTRNVRSQVAVSEPQAKTPTSVARAAHLPATPARQLVAHATATHALATHTTPAVNRGKIMVQVGAIGDRKDAERLVLQLRRRGIHAGIYPNKHDKFLHVQIGPFADPQKAQSMRHRVVTSGYHAILKSAS